MITLAEINATLIEQNQLTQSVNSTLIDMLKVDQDARKEERRQKGKDEEARRERPRAKIARDTPKTFGGAIVKGLGEGLGISQISGWVSNVLNGLGIGSALALAKAGTTALVASFTSLGIAAAIAAWGGDVIKGMFDNLDPDDVVFDGDTKQTIADNLALGTTGAIVARTVAKIFGGKFKGLFTVGGFLAGGLYNIISTKIDESGFEPEFNKAFEEEFGVDLLAGIGSIVGAAAGLLLTKKIYGTIRTAMGFAPKPAVNAVRPSYMPQAQVAPQTTATAKVAGAPPRTAPSVMRLPAGAVDASGKKVGGQFAKIPPGGPLRTPAPVAATSLFGPGGLRKQLAMAFAAYGMSYAVKPLEEFGQSMKDWADETIPTSIRPEGGYKNPLEADKVFDQLRHYFSDMPAAEDPLKGYALMGEEIANSIKYGQDTGTPLEFPKPSVWDRWTKSTETLEEISNTLKENYITSLLPPPVIVNNIDQSVGDTNVSKGGDNVSINNQIPYAIDNHFAKQYMGIRGNGMYGGF